MYTYSPVYTAASIPLTLLEQKFLYNGDLLTIGHKSTRHFLSMLNVGTALHTGVSGLLTTR